MHAQPKNNKPRNGKSASDKGERRKGGQRAKAEVWSAKNSMTHNNEAIGQERWAAEGSALAVGRAISQRNLCEKNAAGEVVFKQSSESYLIFEEWRDPGERCPTNKHKVQTEIGVSSVKYPSKR